MSDEPLYYDELTTLTADTPVVLASADDLMAVQDLSEHNITVRRWHKTIRVRAPDLDQQELIEQESLFKHPRTGVWGRSEARFCAATLRECVVVPHLDDGQAQRLRKKNPEIIKKIVNYIWNVAPLDDDIIERAARALADLDGAAADEPPAPSDAPGA